MHVAPLQQTPIRTLADLQQRLGDVPLERIRFHPYPGSATVQDVIQVLEKEGVCCELVEGVLLEKPMGFNESTLAGYLIGLLNAYVIPANLGLVSAPDGTMELIAGLVRIPDVAFIRWDRLPGRCRPTMPVPQVAANLAVEILSRSNTPGEMAAKRGDYFRSGVEMVWEMDPETRSVSVYTSASQRTVLGTTDLLTGGTVLPGFMVPVATIFAELDRHG